VNFLSYLTNNGSRIALKSYLSRISNRYFGSEQSLSFKDCFDLNVPIFLDSNNFSNFFNFNIDKKFNKFWEGLPNSFHPSGIKFATAQILFSKIINNKPNIVIETGIQSGKSTAVIKEALKINGHGMLFSFDKIRPKSFKETNNCKFIQLPKRKTLKYLREAVNEISPDFWFQDSDNLFNNQYNEMCIASEKVQSFVCNNANVSRGFIFGVNKLEPTKSGVMVDGKRLLGISEFKVVQTLT
jgi:hypothetical protein